MAILYISLSACEVADTSTAEQPGVNLQGVNLQGVNLQGVNLQGTKMLGFQLDGATLQRDPLVNVRVQRGELVADRDGTTLRGAQLVGAQLLAQVEDPSVSPPATATVRYRIASIVAESSTYDPTRTGSTYLYTLEQWILDTSAWQPACPADADGRRVAIPIAAIWNDRGDRIESSTLFTFGCTAGVIAKCYRWGYRPWVTGYGDLVTMHWTCTRLARADYCGDGVPHTRDETQINVWDDLPSPGPIQKHGGLSPLIPPPGMIFEAGWSTRGAECLSHDRWLTIGSLITALCPDRLIPPTLGGIACDNALDVTLLYPSVHMFNESFNLAL